MNRNDILDVLSDLLNKKISLTGATDAILILNDSWRDARKELPIINGLRSDDILFCYMGKTQEGHLHDNGWFYDSRNKIAALKEDVPYWMPRPDPPDFEDENIPDKSKHDLSDYEY